MKYIFYYYWSFGRPCCAKGVIEGGKLIGGNHIPPIEGCQWDISKDEFYNTDLLQLKGKYPWPNT